MYSKGEIFFTSDTHFNHQLMLKYRSFPDTLEMDITLIENWNNKISEDDHIFHLGDFAFVSNGKIKEYVNKLNGNIYLIRGNHDKFGLSDCNSRGFCWVKQYHFMKIKEYKLALFHYPILLWQKKNKGEAIHLHGHCHQNIPEYEKKAIDVGVDHPLCNYAPFHFDEILDILKDREN